MLAGSILLGSSFYLQVASSEPWGAEPVTPGTASGLGSIHFGEHGDGVGTFVFDVERGAKTTGSFTFAAEEHHNYPDVVVRMKKINDVVFNQGLVRFFGDGALHDVPVFVTVSAGDGQGTGSPDWFAIQCANGEGEVVFKARGDLFIGDIVVGGADEGVSPAKRARLSPVP